MRIIGRTAAQTTPSVSFSLEHGQDPATELDRRGFALLNFEQADLVDAEIELSALVDPAEGSEADEGADAGGGSSTLPRVRREAGLPDDVEVTVKQRIAAYAVVRSSRGLLATQFSHRTGAEGRWGLPGGGIDPGETPTAAVLREVLEESGQRVELGDLLTVQSNHWIGLSPDGTAEDYHAVRLVYSAHCPEPDEPRVLDVDGTTAAARWIPESDWADLDWTADWRALLEAQIG